MFIAQFFKARSLKKGRPITLTVWVLRRVKKNAKKESEKLKKIGLYKYHSVAQLSASKGFSKIKFLDL